MFHRDKKQAMNSAAPYFSTFLKAWRRSRGLYKKEAASKLGVPLRTYEAWEWGKNLPGEIVRTTIASRIAEINKAYDSKRTATGRPR